MMDDLWRALLIVRRLLTGRVASGSAKVGDPIQALNSKGERTDLGKITKILHRTGEKGVVELPVAIAGDLVQIAGLSKATVADTICSPEMTEPIETVPIDPPTVCMTFRCVCLRACVCTCVRLRVRVCVLLCCGMASS